MEIDAKKLEQLILKAAREVQQERRTGVPGNGDSERKASGNDEYMDPLYTKESPFYKNCKPCSQRYLDQRRQ